MKTGQYTAVRHPNTEGSLRGRSSTFRWALDGTSTMLPAQLWWVGLPHAQPGARAAHPVSHEDDAKGSASKAVVLSLR